MSGAADKTPVRLTIFNQTYSLLVSGDPAEMEAAATMVDELMTTLARARNLDTNRAAVFACLHLADRVRQLERDLDDLKQSIESKSQRLSTLLDQIIE